MRPPSAPSLKERLLALLLGGAAIAWIVVAAGTFADAKVHTGRMLDAQLLEYAEVLGALADHEALEIAGGSTRHEPAYGQGCTYQVYSLAGSLLLRSHDAPNAPLASRDGFADVNVQGVDWRAYRQTATDEGVVVIVAHARGERDALVRDLALRLLVPVAVGLPLLAVALWSAVTRALRPLDRLAREVGGRGANRLAPLSAGEVPREVLPLVAEMNRLFERLEESFRRERRFTGDAAHELRTPLAALRTHAEVALGATSDERRRRSLEQVVEGVERATGVVEQMLALARMDAGRAPARARRVDVGSIAREAVAESRAAHGGRGVAVDVTTPGVPLEVRGDPLMLRAMVRNLVDNALRFSPDAARVQVGVGRGEGRVRIVVEDAGPGVAPALRERIFDRFFRGEEPRGAGSGLGLAIVRRAAELHGGSARAAASEALGGLRVEVELPEAS